ncbi:uncharacterized protein JCM15063_001059 [Sporobolomyces koalae]|uniref:uncharacterized protein n=1 Tax=Sporobolomyces koalae TaxID=500713 RepID=UPI003175C319
MASSSNWTFSLWSFLPAFLRPSRIGPHRSLLLGLVTGFSLSLSLTSLAIYIRESYKDRWRRKPLPTSDDDDISHKGKRVQVRGEQVVQGIEGLIGNTPLIRINSLSDRLGVEIYGKCEFMNPFGSVKDRVSLQIIRQAEEEGLIHPHTGSTIFEGTSGSTGISIAGIAKARGYNAHIVLPDDVAQEKIGMLEVLGATVEKVRPVSIVDKRHYVNLARLRALEFGRSQSTPTSASESSRAASNSNLIRSTTSSSTTPAKTPQSLTPTTSLSRVNSRTSLPDLVITQQEEPRSNNGRDSELDSTTTARGLFADQFENTSNYLCHTLTTAPEIYQQTSGFVDGFVSGAGTGGTIAGVGRTLKRLTKGACEVVLSDPEGSGLYFWVKEGVMWSEKEEEGKRRRFQVDTIVEGIGLNRITKNLRLALPIIDDAYRVTDAEALSMSRHLSQHDGLFLGSSSAINLVACVKLAQSWIERDHAKHLGLGGRRKLKIVTILCDHGSRHTSKFWNETYLEKNGISYPSNLDWLFPSTTRSGLKSNLDHSHQAPISNLPESKDRQDHGETNWNLVDPDLASSDPTDLPPLRL